MNDESHGGGADAASSRGRRVSSRKGRRRKPFEGKRRLCNVVKVRFKTSFITHDYDGQLLDLELGDAVIAETSKGPAMAEVASEVMRQVVPAGSLKKVLRLATKEDMRRDASNIDKEREAFRFCLERIRARKLPMKLIQVQYMHDGSKAIFFFSADGRIDFRELVRDLANRFRTRIEMRQIGVRDGARMIGGIGSCGRELCCSTFLSQFAPVSIRMAKDQGLTLNPKKVSGMCGRLMCCLVYEQQIYRKSLRRLPRSGKSVETAMGLGVIKKVDVVKEQVGVLLDDGQFERFPVKQVVVLSKRQAEAKRAARDAGEANLADPLTNALSELEEDAEYLWDDKDKGKGGKSSSKKKKGGSSRRRRGRRRSGKTGSSKSRSSKKSSKKGGSSKKGSRRRSRRRRGKKGGKGSGGDKGGS